MQPRHSCVVRLSSVLRPFVEAWRAPKLPWPATEILTSLQCCRRAFHSRQAAGFLATGLFTIFPASICALTLLSAKLDYCAPFPLSSFHQSCFILHPETVKLLFHLRRYIILLGVQFPFSKSSVRQLSWPRQSVLSISSYFHLSLKLDTLHGTLVFDLFSSHLFEIPFPSRLALDINLSHTIEMTGIGDTSEGSVNHGTNPPRITKEDGTYLLVVNESVNLLSNTVMSGEESVSILDLTKDEARKPYRYDTYRSAHQTLQDSDWIFCHRRIDTQAILARTNESPRYFFRVISDQSGRINTDECFQSEAVKQNSRADMASMEDMEIRGNLLAHMRDKKSPSHFISFTVSPLWAFDRALRLKANKETNIRVAIIDTLHLAAPTIIFHTPALLKAFDLEESMWPVMNRGAAEKLVWDELIALGTLIPPDNFLKSYMLKNDCLTPGYLALQTYHFKPLDFANQSIEDALEVLKNNLVKDLNAPCQIRARNFKTDADKKHGIEVRKYQAPRTWRERYTASRRFFGKKLNNWWDENQRSTISDFTMESYMTLVEGNFPPEFQFPVLIALLSTRLYHFEYSGVVEAFEGLAGKTNQYPNPKKGTHD